MTTAEDVTRALARLWAPMGVGVDGYQCQLCYYIFNQGHSSLCPWRMAQEWLALHPEDNKP